MTAAKLRIDLSQGLIEVEGSEAFILELYGDFKDRFSSITLPAPATSETKPPQASPPPIQEISPPVPAKKSVQPVSRAKTKRSGKEEPKFLGDLDLSIGSLGRLKEFHARYLAKTNYEHNLIFVYYLKEGTGLDEVSEDHIFTCYRTVQVKIPGALRQSLIDTKTKGWIVVEGGSVRLTTAGRNHLEHDLAKVV